MTIRYGFYLFILLGIFSEANAQHIEIEIKQQPPYNLFQDILFEIYLINSTDKPLRYFDSRYTSWDSFEETMDLTIAGYPSELASFKDAHEGKYSESSIITLAPGEKQEIKGRLVKLNSPGRYTFSYGQTQSPSLVKEIYAKDHASYLAAKEIDSFTVSGKIEFDVEDRQAGKVENLVEMSWTEWLNFKEKRLYSNNNYFSSLEKALANPEKVYSLNLYCEGISEEMIKRLGELKNLKALSLNNLNIDTLPEEIAALNLYELTIYPNNGINVSFPHGLSMNNSLRSLIAKFYHGFPPEVLKLTNLEELDVRYCSIGKLPDLSSLINLKRLIANDAELKEIDNVGLENLKNLKEISIGGNPEITSISSLTGCLNLEIISCSRGNLKEIPFEIENLSKLEVFDLAINRDLTSLPLSFVNLKNLKSLDISRTNLASLPEGFSELPLDEIMVYETNLQHSNDYLILKERLGKKFRD